MPKPPEGLQYLGPYPPLQVGSSLESEEKEKSIFSYMALLTILLYYFGLTMQCNKQYNGVKFHFFSGWCVGEGK